MPKQATFSFELEAELHDQFMAEAKAADRPAAAVVRDFMHEFVMRQRDGRAHDAWIRAEVEQALRELDEPGAVLISNEDVEAEWRQRRAELMRRLDAGLS